MADSAYRNLTNLQNTSISECTINTTAQPVNDQNTIRDENISEQINEPENEELVINETSKNTEQDEQEEEIDDSLNEHRAPTDETCIQAIIPDYPVTILIIKMHLQEMKYTVLHQEKINTHYHL